jgi:hypothetical protein
MNQFFYEDQVYKVDKKGVKFGLVVENEVSFLQFSKDFIKKKLRSIFQLAHPEKNFNKREFFTSFFSFYKIGRIELSIKHVYFNI